MESIFRANCRRSCQISALSSISAARGLPLTRFSTANLCTPYLGVAAHIAWVEKNKPLVPKLFAAYQEAAQWVAAANVDPRRKDTIAWVKQRVAERSPR